MDRDSEMPNIQPDLSELSFSAKLAKKRLDKACALVGERVVMRIIGLALFLCGGRREKICSLLEMPCGTFFSFLTRFHGKGLDALVDQRETQSIQSPSVVESAEILLCCGNKTASVSLDVSTPIRLAVPDNNWLQSKVIFLSFANWGLLSIKETARLLGLSERHVRELAKQLDQEDVEVLQDKRKGHQKDYAFTPQVKAELIQQFTFNLITGASTSSQVICQQLNEACHSQVSDRAVRDHLTKLGLTGIKRTLIQKIEDFKKNSKR